MVKTSFEGVSRGGDLYWQTIKYSLVVAIENGGSEVRLTQYPAMKDNASGK